MEEHRHYIHLYAYTRVFAPQDVGREVTTSTQGNGSDQLLYGGLYVSTNEQYMKSRG